MLKKLLFYFILIFFYIFSNSANINKKIHQVVSRYNFINLRSFNYITDGSVPYSKLTETPDGSLYGTTKFGGIGYGTIYKIDPNGNESIVYVFTGANGDGASPSANLTLADDGSLYGVTQYGGLLNCKINESSSIGCGTIFKMIPNGKVSIIYSFTNTNNDGTNPIRGLSIGSDGNMYGTTQLGGVGYGTVYKITPDNKESVLYAFTNQNGDGAFPFATLEFDKEGNIYGTTQSGGSGFGTVYKITPDGRESILYAFTNKNGDGAFPYSGLIFNIDNNLYGTTQLGGLGYGTIYKITPDGKESILYAFTNQNGDGAYLYSKLLNDIDGNLYGVTAGGGINNNGTVFKITLTGVIKNLYAFTGLNGDGANPEGSLINRPDGSLYGTTKFGGNKTCNWNGQNFLGCGTIFKITSDGKKINVYTFTSIADGANPFSGLIMGFDGFLYGTTQTGGSINNSGTVYKISQIGIMESVISSFSGVNGDGGQPLGNLVMDYRGNLYGTTSSGGNLENKGTVYKITPSGKKSIIYVFTGINGDGANPTSNLIIDKDGSLYGTTQYGGLNCNINPAGCGTVFKITPDNKESILYKFSGINGDGANPYAGLIMGKDNTLYGTTQYGGTQCSINVNGCGTVFKITPDQTESIIHSFTGINGDGANPTANLIMDSSLSLYGTTEYGGTGNGTVFKIDSNGIESNIYNFTSDNFDGSYPTASLVMDKYNTIYGTTTQGGYFNKGTVFQITSDGKESLLYSFSGKNGDGAYPVSNIYLSNDGAIYGTTVDGGNLNNGIIFKLVPIK